MEGELIKGKSGATSTRLDERYDLIPFAALQAMARRFFVGLKHGARNWEKAIAARDEEFAEIRLAHLYRHVALFAEFRRQEDLDAIMCNGAMICHFKQNGLLAERLPMSCLTKPELIPASSLEELRSPQRPYPDEQPNRRESGIRCDRTFDLTNAAGVVKQTAHESPYPEDRRSRTARGE